jgi:hypothetical protein
VKPEKGIRDQIRQLDKARGLGIKKHRNLCVIPASSPFVPESFEISRKSLNALFGGSLVKNNYAALLIVVLLVEPIQEKIESVRELLKGHLNGIFPVTRRLLNARAE